MIFLEPIANFLLFLHLAASFVLAGSMAHNLILVVGYCRGNFEKQKVEQLYVKISFWAYNSAFLLGALVYPTFRIRARAEYLDSLRPAVSGLFEIKEHWGSIGLALMFAYYLMSTRLSPQKESAKLFFFYVPLCFMLNIVVLYLIYSGYYVTTVKGI
jgi:hypothetical protein